jgi:hypothetical protein
MAGDLAVFVMFALVGRETHASSDPNLIVNALPTLMPFVLIWLLVSVPMGVYRPNVYRLTPLTIIRTLAAWIVTGPIALYVRALLLARTAIGAVRHRNDGPQRRAADCGVFFAWWLKRAGR